MAAVPPGHGYGLDPDKPDVGETKAAQNLENVKVIASAFLEIISMSLPTLLQCPAKSARPSPRSCKNVWPDCKFSPMGAFIFLRFISPSIVAPETIDVEIPKDLTREEQLSIRRGLMIITKIIQNLANNLFFGKEKHMLNAFLADNIAIDIVTRFLSGKHAWDELCGLLVELGTPLDIAVFGVVESNEHRDYLDLMARHAHRSTDSVRSFFVETDSPFDKPAGFLFNLAKIDVEVLDIELLMYYIFKTLSLPIYQNRTFDVILDCAALIFTGISELPLQWLKFCAKLIPYIRYPDAICDNPYPQLQHYYTIPFLSPFCVLQAHVADCPPVQRRSLIVGSDYTLFPSCRLSC